MTQVQSLKCLCYVLETENLRNLIARKVQVFNLAQSFKSIHREDTVRRDIKFTNIDEKIDSSQFGKLCTVHDSKSLDEFWSCAAVELGICNVIY